MQTHFDQLLQQVTQGLDSTATHYVDRHAQLVENAKAALDKAIAFAAGSSSLSDLTKIPRRNRQAMRVMIFRTSCLHDNGFGALRSI